MVPMNVPNQRWGTNLSSKKCFSFTANGKKRKRISSIEVQMPALFLSFGFFSDKCYKKNEKRSERIRKQRIRNTSPERFDCFVRKRACTALQRGTMHSESRRTSPVRLHAAEALYDEWKQNDWKEKQSTDLKVKNSKFRRMTNETLQSGRMRRQPNGRVCESDRRLSATRVTPFSFQKKMGLRRRKWSGRNGLYERVFRMEIEGRFDGNLIGIQWEIRWEFGSRYSDGCYD